MDVTELWCEGVGWFGSNAEHRVCRKPIVAGADARFREQ